MQNVDQYSRYKTFEVSLNKRYGNRWSGSIGYGFTMMSDFPNGPVRNPNNPGLEDRTLWNFKATGSYDAAWGIRLSPVLRHQSGSNYARTLTITVPAALRLDRNLVGQRRARPTPSRWTPTAKTTSGCSTSARKRASRSPTACVCALYFDAFNITNSHASETISRATGLGYLKPSAHSRPENGAESASASSSNDEGGTPVGAREPRLLWGSR